MNTSKTISPAAQKSLSEREMWGRYIAEVQRAVASTPDERTRFIRLWILAVAEVNLAQIDSMADQRTGGVS